MVHVYKVRAYLFIYVVYLAKVLQDATFDNQTEESFVASAGPKALATQYLDQLSRVLCPKLEQFVVFSSVSCGHGNAGQTNYAMSNSVMERICEVRRANNLPAVAIEWGAVGEVGLVADMAEDNVDIVIGIYNNARAPCLAREFTVTDE